MSFRAPTLKYKDPAELKDLCKLRNLTGDVATRADLTRAIIDHRTRAKQEWLSSLHGRASLGDGMAINYVLTQSSNAQV